MIMAESNKENTMIQMNELNSQSETSNFAEESDELDEHKNMELQINDKYSKENEKCSEGIFEICSNLSPVNVQIIADKTSSEDIMGSFCEPDIKEIETNGKTNERFTENAEKSAETGEKEGVKTEIEERQENKTEVKQESEENKREKREDEEVTQEREKNKGEKLEDEGVTQEREETNQEVSEENKEGDKDEPKEEINWMKEMQHINERNNISVEEQKQNKEKSLETGGAADHQVQNGSCEAEAAMCSPGFEEVSIEQAVNTGYDESGNGRSSCSTISNCFTWMSQYKLETGIVSVIVLLLIATLVCIIIFLVLKPSAKDEAPPSDTTGSTATVLETTTSEQGSGQI